MAGIRGGWLTFREAGIVAGVGRWTVRTLVVRGYLITRKVKGRVYVSFDSLERAMALARIFQRVRKKGKLGRRRR